MNPYDDVPYPSHVFPATAPDRLAVIGAILGLRPPDPDRARVLELGSSSGGNILAHAAAFPGSTVLGLDLSPRQIDLGRRTIADLGLRNARLEVADLTTWSPEPEAWDYIICHGVYSWVPEGVQQAILGICRRALSPHGVAVVSWNALPGWHVQGIARDMMRFLVDADAPLAWRATRAKDVLRVLAGVAGGTSPHGRTLAMLAGQLEQLPDSYVAHEYLEEHNQPLYTAELTRQVAAAGLRYLSDSHIADTLPQLHPPEVTRQLLQLATSQTELEQYLDFLFCRPFRSSLLVRPDAPVRRDLGGVDLSGFWLSTDTAGEPDAPDALLRRRAAAAWPGAVPFVQAAAGQPDATRLALEGFLRGTLRLHRHDASLAVRPGERPRAWDTSRYHAARRHLVPNLWHDTLVLDPLDLLLLGWCDGRHTREELAERLRPVAETWEGGAVDTLALVHERLAGLTDKGVFVA